MSNKYLDYHDRYIYDITTWFKSNRICWSNGSSYRIYVLSITINKYLLFTKNSYKYLIKQMEAAVIGIFLMFVASKIDYKLWQKNYKIIYFICMILLLAVCALGREAGGAKRWLDLSLITI